MGGNSSSAGATSCPPIHSLRGLLGHWERPDGGNTNTKRSLSSGVLAWAMHRRGASRFPSALPIFHLGVCRRRSQTDGEDDCHCHPFTRHCLKWAVLKMVCVGVLEITRYSKQCPGVASASEGFEYGVFNEHGNKVVDRP